jgi:hypothetical protein
MIRGALLGLLLGGAATPALAEGGPIRGGEHIGFSRVVMTIDPTTEWSLETADGVATIRFPGRRLAFDPADVFTRMPKTRVLAVRAGTDAAGTTVEVDLGCDCRVSASFVGARYLALDIGDRAAAARAPAAVAETAAARAAREAQAVETAEELLIRQIERAAGQGLVRMTDDAAAPAPPPRVAAKPARDARTERLAAPAPRPDPTGNRTPARPAAAAPVGIALPEGDQVEATTVFDRDSRRARAAATPEEPEACLSDAEVDVAAWTNGRGFTEELPVLRRQLLGEFDVPSAPAVRDLARLYIRFGFGAEARALLAGFGGAETVAEAPLLADLARIMDGLPAAERGPLAFAGACPGAFGLWLALGGRAPMQHGPAQFAEVQAAFEALPVELRLRLGPRFVGRLLDAGLLAEARTIHETTLRAGTAPDAPARLAAARLMAAEGRTVDAARMLIALAEAENETATAALTALVRLALAGDLQLPDRVMADLRAAVLLHRGADREAELRALLAAALASRAELPEAVRESRLAMAAVPAAADRFAALAVASIAAADPARVGGAAYAETAIGAADLVARLPARDAARRTIARRLVALGLPDPALAMIAPALVLDDPAARLIAAEAAVRGGAPAAARTTLGDLAGDEAAALRARAFAHEGRYADALAADGSDANAWLSGDWPRALAAAGDPERAALAGYMAGQPSEAAQEVPPAPAAAFRAPLPDLARPSLGAARALLSTGPGIEGFVEGLLQPEPTTEPTAAP